MSSRKVLIVEDSPSLHRTYAAYLQRDGYACDIAETGQAAREFLAGDSEYACILLDLALPDANGMELLETWRANDDAAPVVVITSNGSIKVAVDAMRIGAADFLVKPFGAERLLATVKNVCKSDNLERTVAKFERASERATFDNFIGKSLAMQAVYKMIEAAAPSEASVMISGETGVGKELAARAVHVHSRRPGEFVAVNCGAIPENLIESEIFGHVKGAFTGATTDRAGAAERAEGGTLFLDELGEMPIDLQSKLLRFLQTGEYMRVGESRPRIAKVRFVAATNRNPLKAVKDGLLREDLYFRLNVIPIELPPLRDRGEDVLLLADSFLQRFTKDDGKSFEGFSPEAQFAMLEHDWPGNVRELENLLRRIVVLNDAPVVTVDMLPDFAEDKTSAIRTATATVLNATNAPSVETVPDAPKPGLEPLWMTEKKAIERAIALCHGNIIQAAKNLGIAPSTIYRKRQSWVELELKAAG